MSIVNGGGDQPDSLGPGLQWIAMLITCSAVKPRFLEGHMTHYPILNFVA